MNVNRANAAVTCSPSPIAARFPDLNPKPGGTMLTTLFAFLKNEEGQSLAEYALILVLVSIAAIAAMTQLGTDISGTFSSVSGTLSGS
jgi:pilus assembly protein Flp/PilA